jgi:hypothetical protein
VALASKDSSAAKDSASKQQMIRDASKARLTMKSSKSEPSRSVKTSGTWCIDCATYPLANVVSNNAQVAAANNENMMAVYRQTQKVK